ncbi:MAG: hypothetical protein ACOVN9_05130 [Inhella sp.]
MPNAPRDVAQIRLDNALRLFEEFVSATVKNADAATLRGLERRFAERLQIQPSYWSQIKSRSRQIGERLARQFEQLTHKPNLWMDQEHGDAPAGPAEPSQADISPSTPQDDDERFIVGLVLTYYRRHPQRARTRLLDLLGEVLTPTSQGGLAPPPHQATRAPAPAPAPTDVWRMAAAGVAPLKPKKK